MQLYIILLIVLFFLHIYLIIFPKYLQSVQDEHGLKYHSVNQ